MALSFVGQDLRNRSFRGRKDLAGADFTGADLRGCDFRDATLIGANFTSTKTGRSFKKLIILILFGGLNDFPDKDIVSFVSALNLIFKGVSGIGIVGIIVGIFVSVSSSSATAFAAGSAFIAILVFGFTLLTAFDSGLAGAVLLAVLFTVVCTGVLVGRSYESFVVGNVLDGALGSITSFLLLRFAWYLFQKSIKILKCGIGTDFRGADLTRAKLGNTHLLVTDFTNANCDLINWQGAEFYLCRFYNNLEDDKVRYLCSNPNQGRGKDYISSDFRNTYLQNADLVDAILRDTNFNGADLRDAKLINADLSNSQALGTDFSGATLTGARIANWGINPETKFENVICTHVYIDEAGKERKPASGDFAEGDFALLVGEFTNTLDFLFKNEINFSAFQYAMQQMLKKNPEAEISINQTKFLGREKDALKRSYDVLNPDADKGKLHADFSESYDIYKRLHPEDNQLIRDLNRQVTYLEGEIKTLKVLNAEKDERIIDLKESNVGFREIAKTQATKSNDKIIIGQVQGDPMSDKNQNISLSAGRDITAPTVAGGDISGTVTVTIQQLHDSDTPEAPKLADLLTDLQKVINESTELTEEDKTKALQYIDTIGKFANNKEDHDMIGTVIDKIIKVVSKAAKLLTPVQAIADGLRKILQL